MGDIDTDKLDIFCLEDMVWIAMLSVDLPSYDFDFASYFSCRRPWQRPDLITAIGRFGVTTNYQGIYERLLSNGVKLIHTPEQYQQSSELINWYPLLQDLTPRSCWYDRPPSIKEIEQEFKWPIFIKGSRQTSRHRSALSIIHSPQQYQTVVEHYQKDLILHWQKFVCREFISLRSIPAPPTDKIPPSFEFRTFWWYGELISAGPYWSAFVSYQWQREEELKAIKVAQIAAQRLNLPFIVIDVAQTVNGDWIVIECNDGQESGYAGIYPIYFWQRLIEIEKTRNKVK